MFDDRQIKSHCADNIISLILQHKLETIITKTKQSKKHIKSLENLTKDLN